MEKEIEEGIEKGIEKGIEIENRRTKMENTYILLIFRLFFSNEPNQTIGRSDNMSL